MATLPLITHILFSPTVFDQTSSNDDAPYRSHSSPIMEKVVAESAPIRPKMARAGKMAPFTSPMAVILPGSEIAPAPIIFFARLNVDFESDDFTASAGKSGDLPSSLQADATEALLNPFFRRATVVHEDGTTVGASEFPLRRRAVNESASRGRTPMRRRTWRSSMRF